MKFDLRETNLIYGIFISGASIPLWLAFMILSLENTFDIALITAIVGGIFLIVGLYLLWQNNQKAKDLDDSVILPSSTAVQLVFQATIFLNMIFMIIGNIAML